jgi:hypothetical protein
MILALPEGFVRSIRTTFLNGQKNTLPLTLREKKRRAMALPKSALV